MANRARFSAPGTGSGANFNYRNHHHYCPLAEDIWKILDIVLLSCVGDGDFELDCRFHRFHSDFKEHAKERITNSMKYSISFFIG